MGGWRRILLAAGASTGSSLVLETSREAIALEELDAAAGVAAADPPEGNARMASPIAVLFQFARCEEEEAYAAMSECASNVAEAMLQRHLNATVHVASSQECYKESLRFASAPLAASTQISVQIAEGHMGAELFAWQLRAAQTAGVEHYLMLTMNSDASLPVIHRSVQSLCGTVPQVHSVLNQFSTDGSLSLLAPLGTMMTAATKTRDILPALRRIRFGEEESCGSIVSEARLERHAAFRNASVAVAGGSYWALHRAVPTLVSELSDDLKKALGSVDDGARDAQKTLTEVFIPSVVRNGGGRLAEMPPAPKPVAMYFPQYHPIPENDMFWGTNFTEWSLLKPYEGEQIRKPLNVGMGGLGYYDLRDVDVRRRQGQLAREYGVHAFAYYHYWFSSVEGNKVMYKVPELRLQDNEPNIPFMLTWANEAWSRHWDGKNRANETMLEQDYGGESEWTDHFYYLLRFFRHPKYIRVEGKPAFAIYRPGLMKWKLEPMLTLWSELARESGLPGLHIIATVGTFYRHPTEKPYMRTPLINAAYHFLASNKCCWLKGHEPKAPENKQAASTSSDSDQVLQEVQYWGAYLGFDNRPRRPNATILDRIKLAPSDFSTAVNFSLEGMAKHPARDIWDNLYFLASWNEWNEQSIMEPDDTYEFGFLKALRSQLHNVPVRVFPG